MADAAVEEKPEARVFFEVPALFTLEAKTNTFAGLLKIELITEDNGRQLLFTVWSHLDEFKKAHRAFSNVYNVGKPMFAGAVVAEKTPKMPWYRWFLSKTALGIAGLIASGVIAHYGVYYDLFSGSNLKVAPPSNLNGICVGADYSGQFFFSDYTLGSKTHVKIETFDCFFVGENGEQPDNTFKLEDGKSEFVLNRGTSESIKLVGTPHRVGKYVLRYNLSSKAGFFRSEISNSGTQQITVLPPVEVVTRLPDNKDERAGSEFFVNIDVTPHRSVPNGVPLELHLDEDHPNYVAIDSINPQPKDLEYSSFGKDDQPDRKDVKEIATFHTVPVTFPFPQQVSVVLRSTKDLSVNEWYDIAQRMSVKVNPP